MMTWHEVAKLPAGTILHHDDYPKHEWELRVDGVKGKTVLASYRASEKGNWLSNDLEKDLWDWTMSWHPVLVLLADEEW
jgi:hypothetical protein